MEALDQIINNGNIHLNNFAIPRYKLPNSYPSVAVLIHLYKSDLWEEMRSYIWEIEKITTPILMINLHNPNPILENEIRRDFSHTKVHFTSNQNHGMDIGGFFVQLDYIIENKIECDIYVKLHSKSMASWRRNLIIPIIKNFRNIMDYFQLEPTLGMMGSQNCALEIDNLNRNLMVRLCESFSIDPYLYIDKIEYDTITDVDEYFMLENERSFILESNIMGGYINANLRYDFSKESRNFPQSYWNIVDKHIFRELLHTGRGNQLKKNKNIVRHPKQIVQHRKKTIQFYAGTIFCGRMAPLISFMLKHKINVNELLNTFPEGRCENMTHESSLHVWERFFSIIYDNWGYRILNVEDIEIDYIRNHTLFLKTPSQPKDASLCILTAHFTAAYPYQNLLLYVKELKKHFTFIQIVYSQDVPIDSKFYKELEEFKPIQVENKGYDMYKWYTVTKNIRKNQYCYILLTNDTCYLNSPLDPVLKEYKNSTYSMYGLTSAYRYFNESDYPRYHIQSYFRIFDAVAISIFNHYIQQNFQLLFQPQTHWNLVQRDTKFKEALVNTMEVEFSNLLVRLGLRIGSYLETSGVYNRPNIRRDITLDIPLLRKIRFPILKYKFWISYQDKRKNQFLEIYPVLYQIHEDFLTDWMKYSLFGS